MSEESKWTTLADRETLERTMEALRSNNFVVYSVETGEEAKEKALSLIPEGAEIMNMRSTTLNGISVADAVTRGEPYRSIRSTLSEMDEETQHRRKRELGGAPPWAIGSVHAVTEDGHVMIASNTGSQLPAYAYGADHVIWVVGTHKIVKNIEEGWQRIYEHSLPLESERARKAYGTAGSAVNKVLIINKELNPERTQIIFVGEVLGF